MRLSVKMSIKSNYLSHESFTGITCKFDEYLYYLNLRNITIGDTWRETMIDQDWIGFVTHWLYIIYIKSNNLAP